MRLLTSDYGNIDYDEARGIARFTRSTVAYPSLAAVDEHAEQIAQTLGKLRSGFMLLVDLRSIVPRNDPGFEVAIADVRHQLMRYASRTAILAETAIGALQVARYIREDGYIGEVFHEEHAALAYLRMPSDRPSRFPSDRPSRMPSERPPIKIPSDRPSRTGHKD